MFKLFLCCILAMPVCVKGQNTGFPSKQIQFFAGQSFNGTGDAKGVAFDAEFGQYISKNASWYVAIGSTIHDKTFPVFYTDRLGNNVDGSVRATIAAFQLSGLYGHSFIRNLHHEFLVKAGPIIRYQSSSYWDEVGVYYPIITSLPFPVVEFINKSPQRTLALCGNLELGYNYTISKKVSVGIMAELQTDTNGDTISQLLFSIGRRL